MTNYELLITQMRSLAEGDRNWLPILANASALLFGTLKQINWAGFYMVYHGTDEDKLLLGPFQGKPACVQIARGRGVCGSAWERDSVINVADVHTFPGHIACDAASASEIVIPLHNEAGAIVGVLDIDSPVPARFTQTDSDGLTQFSRILEEIADFP